MIRFIFISLIFVSLFSACSGVESKLEGKWKFEKEVNNQGQTMDSKSSELKELTYEFHDHNRYSKQGISSGSGEEKLITMTGEWKVSKLENQNSKEDKFEILLREEKLEGVFEMKFEIDTLAENELVWLDNRKNKFYFTKISE